MKGGRGDAEKGRHGDMKKTDTEKRGNGDTGMCGQLGVRKGGLPPLGVRKTLCVLGWALAIILFSFVGVFAQQIGSSTTQEGVSYPRGTYAIRNARIVTLAGPDIENGTVVIRDGKIDAVGASVNVPAGAQTIEGRGLSVYPGMMDAGTSLGLVEVDSEQILSESSPVLWTLTIVVIVIVISFCSHSLGK